MWRGAVWIAIACSCSASKDPCEPTPVVTCSDCAVNAALRFSASGAVAAVAAASDGAAEVGSCDRVWRVGEQGAIEGSTTVPLAPKEHIGFLGVSGDGNMYVSGIALQNDSYSSGTLYAFDAAGHERWSQAELANRLAAAPEGPYAEIAGLDALNPDGTLRWSEMADPANSTWTPDQRGNLLFANDSQFVKGTQTGTITELDVGGNAVWQKTFTTTSVSGYPFQFDELAVGPDGSIAVLCAGDGPSLELGDASIAGTGTYVVMLDATGHTLWGQAIEVLGNPEVAVVGSAAVVIGASITDQARSVVLRVDRSGVTTTIDLVGGPMNQPFVHGLQAGPAGTAWFVAEPVFGAFQIGDAALPGGNQYNFLFNVRL
ncbi:MAG: hypothetical protein ACM31C_12165 [Acidobacteriota bacterium]